MKISSIRYADGELHLACSAKDGVQAAYKLKPGDYDIVPHKEKRSLNANAYSWALVDKIAAVLRISPIEVYRNAIENTGGLTASTISIKAEAAAAFIKSWEAGHIGRQCREIYNSDGWVTLMCIYGSSDFDRGQMSRFIDTLIQDAKALGIETMEQGRLESLLNSWG